MAESRWALEISMPTKIGVVFMSVDPGGEPGVSRPCYAAWWPGDCSGWGRERTGVAARAFLRPRRTGQWGDGLPPLSPCYDRREGGVGNIQGGSQKGSSADSRTA